MPASQIAMPTPQRTRCNNTFISRRSTTTNKTDSSYSDDEDAITPCSSPPPEPAATAPHHHHQHDDDDFPSARKTPQSSAPAPFDPTAGADMDDAQLWRRMLEIQRAFGCYNSARMSAALLALEMGVDAGRLAPSRSCLDLMNESITDIPEAERQNLLAWLHDNPPKGGKRSSVWKRNSVF